MYSYKVIEHNKDNPYLSVIQKRGVNVEFTLSDLVSNIEGMKKQITEIEAKVGIEKATMQNIIHSHSKIIELVMGQKNAKDLGIEEYLMTEKDRVAIDMFERSRRFVNGAEEKLIEFQLALKDDQRSLEEACVATKIKVPVVAKFEKAKKENDGKPTTTKPTATAAT